MIDYEKQKNERDAWIAQNPKSFIFAKDRLKRGDPLIVSKTSQIETLKKDRFHYLSDYQENEFEFVSRAARSENSAITYQETFEILEGRTDGIAKEKVSVVRGIIEARRIVVAAVIEKTTPDLNLLRSINRAIESGLSFEAGLIRGERSDKSGLGTFVSLGNNLNFVPPEPGIQGKLLVERFNQILDSLDDSFLNLVILCCELTYSQLFYNGNKRTAREFANAILLQNGFPCLSVDDEEKFLQSVTEMDKSGDYSCLVNYFCDTILSRFPI